MVLVGLSLSYIVDHLTPFNPARSLRSDDQLLLSAPGQSLRQRVAGHFPYELYNSGIAL